MNKVLYLVALFAIGCQQPVVKEKENKEINLQISFIKQKSPTNNSLRGISVIDENIAWLSGAKGTVLRTIDGGENWELLPAPDTNLLDFRDVEAFSENEAIVMSAGFPSRVYKTENAGKSWELVHENKDSASFMNSIAFKNKNEGIIIGDQLNGRHLILRSGNGGNTWKRIDSIDVPKPLKVENGFAASGSCIAITKKGRFFIGLGGEQSRVFSSVNGFKWKAKTTPMKAGSAASGIYSIAHGSGKLMAVGGNYMATDAEHYPILSLNGGKSWLRTKGAVNGYRSIIDFCEQEKVWVSGGTNGMDLSYDDGDTWDHFSQKNINTLQFIPNSSKAFIATKDGEIYCLIVSLAGNENRLTTDQ